MSQIRTETVRITDYRMKTQTLAKVIVSYTGRVDREFIHDELTRQMGGSATPVKASFKKIREGVAVGFLKANRAVVLVNDKELKANYRVMSSNIVMDPKDTSLWEIRTGAGGKYLARHGQEDLEALVQASRIRRPDVDRLANLVIAKAAKSEIVSFVDADGDVDHGFAVRTDDTRVQVLSFQRRMAMTVDYDNVVSICPVEVDATLDMQVRASLTPEQKKQANEYWTRLYSYAPEYMREVIRQVNEGTFA